MDWYTYLKENVGHGRVRCLSTATTGVHEDDELIAATVVDDDGAPRTIFRHVDQDKLHAAQDYHRISMDMLRERALPDEAFKEALREMVSGVVFTYNVPFHMRYIVDVDEDVEAVGVDMPLMWRAAMANIAVDEHPDVGSLHRRLYEAVGKPGAFKRIVSSSGWEGQQYLLPCEDSALAVRWLWQKLAGAPVSLTGE